MLCIECMEFLSDLTQPEDERVLKHVIVEKYSSSAFSKPPFKAMSCPVLAITACVPLLCFPMEQYLDTA